MFSPVCQKCNSSAVPVKQWQSFIDRLLKVATGYQPLHCSNCGARWSQSTALRLFCLLERVIYLILIGEACYLLWNYIPH